MQNIPSEEKETDARRMDVDSEQYFDDLHAQPRYSGMCSDHEPWRHVEPDKTLETQSLQEGKVDVRIDLGNLVKPNKEGADDDMGARELKDSEPMAETKEELDDGELETTGTWCKQQRNWLET